MVFFIILFVVITQRLVELLIAKSNEKWMRNRGAYEVGQAQYKYIVLVHVFFFISLISEVVFLQKTLASWWWVPFAFFIIAQSMRVWSLSSLGRFWNTKIIILPGANVVAKGPYKFMRHPNYVIVSVEILMLPLIFQAYATAIFFTIANALVLSVRICQEEAALQEATDYQEKFSSRFRFFPTIEKE
ncbi:isoprenylcysteine carboxyl methyltransferase family protein [Alkalihalobacterium elongatum]|uniref:isoprenylcysteine carboxyl methyltransferase family protein n=1 Tax=Alkalihalobacterium elongatum TaxID=2675466 RepID=UPI001C1FDF3F|nr:isoprenylcysteine carboxylmethyltransferase family protein [Alkalihalobacterium elongatum]